MPKITLIYSAEPEDAFFSGHEVHQNAINNPTAKGSTFIPALEASLFSKLHLQCTEFCVGSDGHDAVDVIRGS